MQQTLCFKKLIVYFSSIQALCRLQYLRCLFRCDTTSRNNYHELVFDVFTQPLLLLKEPRHNFNMLSKIASISISLGLVHFSQIHEIVNTELTLKEQKASHQSSRIQLSGNKIQSNQECSMFQSPITMNNWIHRGQLSPQPILRILSSASLWKQCMCFLKSYQTQMCIEIRFPKTN